MKGALIDTNSISEKLLAVISHSKKTKSYTPTQLVPFPSNPWLHAHVKEPIEFVHVAFWWQSWVEVVHSFISVKE